VVGDSARCARAPTKCLESSASSAVEESSTTYSALAVRFSFVAEWLSIASIVAATAACNPVEARSLPKLVWRLPLSVASFAVAYYAVASPAAARRRPGALWPTAVLVIAIVNGRSTQPRSPLRAAS
jgi:hypothetical protein